MGLGALGIKKKLIVELDVINGTIDYEHDGEPTYSEVLAMLEYTKMMISKAWMDELNVN